MASQLFALLAAAGLVSAGVAATGETRSFAALPTVSAEGVVAASAVGASAAACRVDVNRAGVAGTADVSRVTLQDGSCACVVTTGVAANNGAAEDVVATLQRDRACYGAGQGGEEGTDVLPIVLGGAAMVGLAVALSSSSNG